MKTKQQHPESYVSQHAIGDRVKLTVIQTAPIYAYVRAITFTSSKVRYALWVQEAETTLHNVDSAYVEPCDKGDFDTHEFSDDNYS